MKRSWRTGLILLFAALTLPLAGCLSRPAPRPGGSGAGAAANPAPAGIDVPLSDAVTRTVSATSGAGLARAVVVGDLAVIALQLNAPVPGGTAGTTTGFSPATPGGGTSSGGSTPGGTPSYTQAAPNGVHGLATSGGTTTTPAPSPSSFGAAPLDVMNRVANQVRAHHAAIREVRFAYDPADAARLGAISRDLMDGKAPGPYADDVRAIAQRAQPAGTVAITPGYPPEATKPAPGGR